MFGLSSINNTLYIRSEFGYPAYLTVLKSATKLYPISQNNKQKIKCYSYSSFNIHPLLDTIQFQVYFSWTADNTIKSDEYLRCCLRVKD